MLTFGCTKTCVKSLSDSFEMWFILIQGNYYIHEIVKTQDYELRIDLRDQAGNWAFAGYRNFFIGGPGTSYTLDESEYYGNAGTY